MRVPQQTNLASSSSRAGILDRLGPLWSGRRGLLVLGVFALTLGVGLNWGWLAAAGITPILIGLLPCAAMCALGLCMPRLMRPASAATRAPPPLQLENSGRRHDAPFAAQLPAIEGVEQSCCHAPTEKENDLVRDNS